MVGGTVLTTTDHVLRSWVRSYCWALFGLGSARFAYASDLRSKPLWFLNVLMHLVETGFWWGEALEPGAVPFVPRVSGIPSDPMQGMVLFGEF
jgi:hypothetical protein